MHDDDNTSQPVRYRTIVADPPWRYDYPGGPGNAAPWAIATPDHYSTMHLDEIKAIDVQALAAPGAHLYLWAVLPMLRQAFEVVEAWGFHPATMLTWCKPGPGFGRGWRGNTEHVIVARDSRRAKFDAIGDGTWFVAPRGQHSAKPELFMDRIESMSPGPRVELFSRRARIGWDTWGNESLHGGAA